MCPWIYREPQGSARRSGRVLGRRQNAIGTPKFIRPSSSSYLLGRCLMRAGLAMLESATGAALHAPSRIIS